MVVRSQLGNAFFSRSNDRGETWSHPQASGLSASESMPALCRIPGTGHLLLVWNNADYDHTYDHSGKRTPLTIAVSTDEGRTWMHQKNVEDAPDCEFSNVACSVLSDNRVILSYFTSKMVDQANPGKFGRDRMSLKSAITTVDWLYA